MLKRISSLLLAIVLSASAFAAGTQLSGVHVCRMEGMSAMSGMDQMPCCKKHANTSRSETKLECCVTLPQETGSSATTFSIRTSSFTATIVSPSLAQPPVTLASRECVFARRIFLPDLQNSYIRHLALLI